MSDYETIKTLIVKELTGTEELTEDMFDSFFEALKIEVRENHYMMLAKKYWYLITIKKKIKQFENLRVLASKIMRCRTDKGRERLGFILQVMTG